MHERITRRSALGSIVACACCLSAPGIAGAAAKTHKSGQTAPHWSYEGAEGPQNWGKLSPDFKTCQLGVEQTPIDLGGGIKAQFDKPFALNYKAVGGVIVNNGHTIQVNVDKGCTCTIEGTAYDLLQFHFHHPSEHLVSGKPLQMEMHLVHKAHSGALAVIGVFLQEGAASAPLAPVFDGMPHKAKAEKPLPAPLDPSAVFPGPRGYYRYMGSLTTPPCSEGLTWTVFKTPAEASREQIAKFAKLFPHNARPVQKRNHRFLLEGGS